MEPTVLISPSAWASALSGLLEGSGIPWPGGIVLTAAGVEHTGLAAAVFFGTLFACGYTLSAALQYLLGRYCGHMLTRLLSPALQEKMERAMARYGEFAVLWTRPLAVGNYVSIPAGMMRMNPGKFLLYTFVGIWPWSFGMTLAGSILGSEVSTVASLFPVIAGVVIALAVLAGLRKLWLRIHASRQASTFCD